MRGRVLTWAGGIAALGAGAALVVYLSSVGLDDADKLASVIGLFVGLVSLAVGVWGLLLTRREHARTPASGTGATGNAAANRAAAGTGTRTGTGTETGRVSSGVHNEISGGTFHGPVVQGHTVTGPAVSGPGQAAPRERERKD
ncbi:hypothetical protein [Microbispora triticiradicis]|uniref:hypothetical protein n=1 Tax=Microbispora triticiradicis TaxID=2200763 RepID=UPI001AD75756|nr:hypothetical protein [Microbispora triticiradicis]MBO4272431.1 hypothetical protein [Microbispora triticiradicis]